MGCLTRGDITLSQCQRPCEKRTSGMGDSALGLESGDQGWSLGDLRGSSLVAVLVFIHLCDTHCRGGKQTFPLLS